MPADSEADAPARNVEALAADQLGRQRRCIREQLLRLAQLLRSGEQLALLARAGRRRWWGRWVVGVTDERLLLLKPSGDPEIFDYTSLTSVSVDGSSGELALVTTGDICWIKVRPPQRAVEIGRLVAARIGPEHVNASIPGVGRQVWRVVAMVILSTVVVAKPWRLLERGQSDRRPVAHVVAGSCFDFDGRTASCRSSSAAFVVVVRKRAASRCIDEDSLSVLDEGWGRAVHTRPGECMAFIGSDGP